jgi:hypothetical protein
MSPAVAAPAASPPLVDLGPEAAHLGRRPFSVRHRLADHPLFALERLLELARELPEGAIEYNAGTLSVDQEPAKTPRNGLSPQETIRRITECRSWMVLWNVEQVPAYRDLLHACLAEAEHTGLPAARDVIRREGFIFLSSPGSVTPYHMDPEMNFLLQVRGRKVMNVFDGSDRGLLSEEELERMHGGQAHRNLRFKDEYQARAHVFDMGPGDGCHVPEAYPHWVKVGDEVSVSFSITYYTRQMERRQALYALNHSLRQRGWRPRPPGVSAWRDFVKYNAYRVLRRLRRLWGGGEGGKGRYS